MHIVVHRISNVVYHTCFPYVPRYNIVRLIIHMYSIQNLHTPHVFAALTAALLAEADAEVAVPELALALDVAVLDVVVLVEVEPVREVLRRSQSVKVELEHTAAGISPVKPVFDVRERVDSVAGKEDGADV